MSKLHLTVWSEGKRLVNTDCDALMVGFLKGNVCDTLTEAPNATIGQIATLCTALLQHIEETTESDPQYPDAIILLNKIMDTKEIKEDGTV